MSTTQTSPSRNTVLSGLTWNVNHSDLTYRNTVLSDLTWNVNHSDIA